MPKVTDLLLPRTTWKFFIVFFKYLIGLITTAIGHFLRYPVMTEVKINKRQ